MRMSILSTLTKAVVILAILPLSVICQPRIEVAPLEINFGAVEIDRTIRRTLSFDNSGDERLLVEALDAGNGAFNVSLNFRIEIEYFEFRRTENNHSIIANDAIWDGEPLALGMEVGVITPDGLCAGCRVIEEVGERFGIAAWQDDANTDEIDGFRNGEEIEYRFWDPFTDCEVVAEVEYVYGPEVFQIPGFSAVLLEVEGGSHRFPDDSFILDSEGEIDINVYFQPEAERLYETDLTISSNDPDNHEVIVELIGRGVVDNGDSDPVIHEPSVEDIFPLVVHEGEDMEVNFTADDPDNDAADLTWTITDQNDLPGDGGELWDFTDSGDGSAVFTWEIGYDIARDRPYRPMFRVADPDGNHDDIELIISVWNRPWPPPDPIPDQELVEDCGRTVLVDLDTLFDERDDRIFDFNIEVDPQQLRLSIDNETHELSAHPLPDFWVGSPGIEVVVRASEENDVECDMPFRIAVHPVNDPPGRFAMLMPENRYEAPARQEMIPFVWQEAGQNDYEADVVTYFITFINGDVDPYDTLETQPFDACINDINIRNILDLLGLHNPPDRLARLFWWVTAQDDSVEVIAYNAAFTINIPIPYNDISSELNPDIPDRFTLLPAYPNPFNNRTTVRFGIPASGQVTLSLINSNGQYMTNILKDSYYSIGYHQIDFGLKGLPAGSYILYLEHRGRLITQQVLLLK
ncbi:MAG: T9SS type A sorting domain-containing protein [Candidatus Hatepunaea meridiana]|nr:T9SS type A sorting domain-containing protein [Candidatus Hatepunaea meridiana]